MASLISETGLPSHEGLIHSQWQKIAQKGSEVAKDLNYHIDQDDDNIKLTKYALVQAARAATSRPWWKALYCSCSELVDKTRLRFCSGRNALHTGSCFAFSSSSFRGTSSPSKKKKTLD